MIYLQLLWSFIQIGLFSFGGGYASMPLIQEQVVNLHSWLTMEQFADIITISQMTPGPVAINAATFVGIRVAGIIGAVIATVGCVLPSCIIVLFLAFIYYRYQGLSLMQGVLYGLRPAVVAMIASAGLSLLCMALYNTQTLPADLSQMNLVSAFIFVSSLFILRKWKLNPILVMVAAGCVSVLYFFIH